MYIFTYMVILKGEIRTMANCKNCGNNLPDGATFCSNCGTPVENTAAQAQTEQTQNGTKQNAFFDSTDYTAEFNPADINQNKVMAVLAYFGILVLIPIFAAKDSKFAKFHSSQGLNLAILMVAQSIVYTILIIVFSILLAVSHPVGAILLGILGIVNSILWLAIAALAIYGIVNAVTGKAKKLPIIGKFEILGRFMK